MKKWIAMLLALAMVFALVACATDKGQDTNTEDPAVVTDAPDAEKKEDATAEPAADVTDAPVTEEPVTQDVSYVPYALDFKNKTGLTITGLYLYATGAEDKGSSFCEAEWIDKDADAEGTRYEFFTYLVRPASETYELYVEFADGTNATWAGLTIHTNDKLSLKDGIDPAGWEQEAVDDEADLATMAALVAAGKTGDNFYPGYEKLGLEIKNKTGLGITEFYFYETGSEEHYNNMVEYLVDDSGAAVSVWQSGKGGLYVFSYFLRPHADTYEITVVYEDGTSMTIPDIDLWTLNGDGFASNEISMKDAVDPDLTAISYDDGDPEPLQYIKDALAGGAPADGWYPVY